MCGEKRVYGKDMLEKKFKNICCMILENIQGKYTKNLPEVFAKQIWL